MKRIKYTGEQSAVNYRGLCFVKDKPVEVEDDLAEQLKKKPFFSGVRGKARVDDDQ